MKKLAIALASTALLSGTAVANFQGPYVGAQFGVGTGRTNFDQKLTTRNAADVLGHDMRVNGRRGEVGFIGGLHAGWDFVFNNKFLAGIEVSGDLSNLSSKINAADFSNQSINTKVDMDWAITAGARGGIVMDKTAFYVSASWVGADWKVTQTADSRPTANGKKSTFKKSHFISGFRPAVGVMASLNDRLLLSVEAGYTWFESKTVRNNFVDAAFGGTNNNTQNLSTEIKPEVFDAKLKLSWKIMGTAA